MVNFCELKPHDQTRYDLLESLSSLLSFSEQDRIRVGLEANKNNRTGKQNDGVTKKLFGLFN